MNSVAKKELMGLCRDINSGYFSPNTLDDIVRLARLFSLCGKSNEIDGERKKEQFERYEKKEAVKQIYLSHLSLIKYPLTQKEMLRCVVEIIGTEQSYSKGYCLWAKHLGCSFEARDLMSIAKSLLREIDSCSEKDKCLERMRKIKFSVLFGSTKKYLNIKKSES